MGIYDRPYIRDEPPRAGPRLGGGHGSPLARLGMFSANTWIIIICIVVFVINGFTGVSPVDQSTIQWTRTSEELQVLLASGDLQEADDSAIVVTHAYQGVPVLGERPIYVQTPRGRVRVGSREVIFQRLLDKWLHFSTQRGFLELQFWRLIGFQFLHANPSHLIFNMLGLFFFGPLVEQYLGSKRYVAFYLLCGICGALMYVLLNLGGMIAGNVQIPGLLFNDLATPLIGASAGVFGVLMAGAYLAPNVTVLLFFFIPMRLVTLAYGLVVLAVLAVVFNWQNAGGEAGHLGGAIAGFYFIRHPHHLHNFFDILGRVDPTSHHYSERRREAQESMRPYKPDEVDRILDKINERGIHSLTDREKRILREAGER